MPIHAIRTAAFPHRHSSRLTSRELVIIQMYELQLRPINARVSDELLTIGQGKGTGESEQSVSKHFDDHSPHYSSLEWYETQERKGEE